MKPPKLVQAPACWDALPYEFAEWLELLALVRWPHPSGAAELRAFLEGPADDLAVFNNSSEQEDRIESKIQAVFEELGRREKWSEGGYPFVVENGTVILSAGAADAPIPEHSIAYLFGLLATYYRHDYFQRLPRPKAKHDAFPSHEKLENLFQVCGTIAAAGLIDGHSIAFGFPRADGSPFYHKLSEVGRLLGDGVPKEGWEPGASSNPKDAKVDIIAWRPCPDQLPGQLYLLGQCASGDNWELGKSPVIDHHGFHEYYWSRRPHSPLVTATFLPFDFRTSVLKSSPRPLDEVWEIARWRLTGSHGIIVDRFRLAHYFALGLETAKRNQRRVECVNQLTDVSRWITDGIEFLKAGS